MKMVASLTIAIGLALLDVASAQQPAPPPAKISPAKTSPAKTPTLDAEALRIPDSIHDTRAKPIDKSPKPASAAKLPNKFDLGAYDLEFKASHAKDVNPRTGFDSGEKANLSNTTPGRKSDPALPNYFGLKLSAPVK